VDAENKDLKQAEELYELILQTSNQFLKNASLDIKVLQSHNPSYEEVAKLMRRLAIIIHELSDDFAPMLAQKAIDYVCIMEKMALAIKNDDPVTLSEQVGILSKKPGC